MTTVLPHIKLAWGGTIGNPGQEVWTTGLAWMAQTDGIFTTVTGSPTEMNNALEALATAVTNWFQSNDITTAGPGGACIDPSAYLSWFKLNHIGVDGKYVGVSHTKFITAVAGGGGSTSVAAGFSVPWQMATAITLRTGISRGRGSKGRVYPPLSGGLPQVNSPYQHPDIVSAMERGFGNLINSLNSSLFTDTTPGGRVCIVSTVPTSGPHVGAAALLTPVTHVEVDAVPDVQRRRVNAVARSISPVFDVTGVTIG